MIGVTVLVAALDQQVARLDVPVHQSPVVRGVQRAGGLGEQEYGHVGLQPTALADHLPQVGPRDAAHRDIQQPAA